MVVGPNPFHVASPALLMVAIEVCDELQVTKLVMSAADPSLNVPVALN